jgi:hypothetical protein
MIYLMMADQTFNEVPGAMSARVEEGKVICCDVAGLTLATFDAAAVTAFGVHEALRDPAWTAEPAGVDIMRDPELAQAPLSAPRMTPSVIF